MLASKYFHFHNVADLSCSRMGGTCRYNWTSCSRRATRLSVFCRGACYDNGVYHVHIDNYVFVNESNRNRKLNSLRFFLNFDCDDLECLLLVNSDIYLLLTSVFIIDNTY